MMIWDAPDDAATAAERRPSRPGPKTATVAPGWKPTLRSELWDPDHTERAMGLDDACADVLSEVASALPHMPEPARKALVQEMRLWKEEAIKSRPQQAVNG